MIVGWFLRFALQKWRVITNVDLRPRTLMHAVHTHDLLDAVDVGLLQSRQSAWYEFAHRVHIIIGVDWPTHIIQHGFFIANDMHDGQNHSSSGTTSICGWKCIHMRDSLQSIHIPENSTYEIRHHMHRTTIVVLHFRPIDISDTMHALSTYPMRLPNLTAVCITLIVNSMSHREQHNAMQSAHSTLRHASLHRSVAYVRVFVQPIVVYCTRVEIKASKHTHTLYEISAVDSDVQCSFRMIIDAIVLRRDEHSSTTHHHRRVRCMSTTIYYRHSRLYRPSHHHRHFDHYESHSISVAKAKNEHQLNTHLHTRECTFAWTTLSSNASSTLSNRLASADSSSFFVSVWSMLSRQTTKYASLYKWYSNIYI